MCYLIKIHNLGACSSSAESIENLLSYKTTSPEDFNKAVILIVGGAAEALNCKPSTYRIIYNKRKGFIRMALKTGFVFIFNGLYF